MLIDIKEYVNPGKIFTGNGKGMIVSTPLGSCIAFIVYDKIKMNGGMAHIMLPGKMKGNRRSDTNKYAEHAIETLVNDLCILGSGIGDLSVCIIGGANVLRAKDDSNVKNITKSVIETASTYKLNIISKSTGGYERRGAALDLGTGEVYYSVGNGGYTFLCNLCT